MSKSKPVKPESQVAYTGETIPEIRFKPQDFPPLPQKTKSPVLFRKTPQQVVQPKSYQRSSLTIFLHRIWFGLRLLLLIALLLVLAGGFSLYQQVQDLAKVVVLDDVRPNPPLASPFLGGINLLIIGADERPDSPEEGIRSDTLILAHIDAAGHWLNLLSIPRDTQVELKDVGISKINAAFGQGYALATEMYGPKATPVQGGMAFSAQTVEQFLGLPDRGLRVDYTLQISFTGFEGLIDALGGLMIDVPTQIIDEEYPTEDFGTRRIEFQPGLQRMNGEQALIYARTRHADSDFERSLRQQQVFQAVTKELRAKGLLGQLATLPKILESFKGKKGQNPPLLTTLPIGRLDTLGGLAMLASDFNPKNIGQIRLNPAEVEMIEEGTNLIWDKAGVREQVTKLLNPPQNSSPSGSK